MPTQPPSYNARLHARTSGPSKRASPPRWPRSSSGRLASSQVRTSSRKRASSGVSRKSTGAMLKPPSRAFTRRRVTTPQHDPWGRGLPSGDGRAARRPLASDVDTRSPNVRTGKRAHRPGGHPRAGDPARPRARRASRPPRGGARRGEARHRRAGRDARAGARLPGRRRPPPDRGRPRPREDADHQDDGGGPRRLVPADPVHARPRPVRPRRDAHLPPRPGHVRDRSRPGLLQLPPRRRDQPGAREGAVRAARSDAGASGDDRPRHARRAGAVPRDGDAEPDRVGGHVPASRGSGRPLHAQGARRVPRARRGADRRPPLARGPRRGEADPPALRARRAAAEGEGGVRRPRPRQLRGQPRCSDPRAGLVRARGDLGVRRVRREPARPHRARPERPRTRTRPRPRLRDPVRSPLAREGRLPAPPGPDLPGARGGAQRGRRPRRRDRGGPAAAARARETRRRVIRVLKALGAEPTPDRPGPGPVSEGLLKALELTVARRVDGLLAGDHRSALLGRGTELAQVRPYVPGDDVRLIDWNVTARTTEPHVRVHLAERVLVTWIALGVTLAVGHAATIRGNRVGLVGFGGATERVLPPTQGRAGLVGLLLALRDGHEPDGQSGMSLAAALARVAGAARQRALIVVVSDFRGPRDWRKAVLRLAGRHQVVAMEIRDPREQALEPVGTVWLVDPESGHELQVDTNDRTLRTRFAEAATAERASVARELASAGVGHAVLSTDGDWLRDLALFLRRHRR